MCSDPLVKPLGEAFVRLEEHLEKRLRRLPEEQDLVGRARGTWNVNDIILYDMVDRRRFLVLLELSLGSGVS